MAWIKNHPKLVGAGVVGAAVVAYLAIAVFGVHTLFIDDVVNEEGPVFASGAAPSGIASDAISPDMADDMTEAMVNEPVVVEVDEDMPDMPATEPEAQSETAPPEPVITTVFAGNFIDRSHPTSGVADVLTDGSPQRFLRFENFETDNGPDLNVYLTTASADAPGDDIGANFVDLGDLKGNIGDQNYEIPADVDLNQFSTVVIWCVRFGVAFGAADLSPSS